MNLKHFVNVRASVTFVLFLKIINMQDNFPWLVANLSNRFTEEQEGRLNPGFFLFSYKESSH